MSDQIHKFHDAFFRKELGDLSVVRNLLQHELPERLAAPMDLSTIERVDGSYVSKAMRSTFSDLVFRVKLKGRDDGKKGKDGGKKGADKDHYAYIYTLFEHKSYMDDWCSLQLLKYKAAQWEICQKEHPTEKLPPIISLVLYHGKRAWRRRGILDLINTEDPEALRPYTPAFDYVLWDVSHMDRQREELDFGVRAFLEILYHIKRDSLRQYLPQITYMLAQSPGERSSILEKIETYLKYAIGCSDHIDEETIEQSLESSNTKEELMATLAQKWVNEGEARGEARGILGGQSKLLRKQIQLRFGQIPSYVEEQLAKATEEQLERFAENVLTATSAEEVVKLN
ncbi:MAG: Rpn family recombination-promoting nuclease/putative transposase [Desulfuromonadaceae bacterium]|nr:Rpn family recombination-promoting nuclease/putative transposase [Desulfuromonas sp.]MDY0185142.1 Rpn family recombination-promoting nuclease/putative transposase [Desulfuromonadaceae bacterium]